MPILIHKVFAYITHGNCLLVFRHADFPQAGIQVPAGTIQPDEPPDEAVLREVYEETGLSGFTEVHERSLTKWNSHGRDFYEFISVRVLFP